MCENIAFMLDIYLIIGARASPPTSPQRAQSTARQAERERRVMGSPPRARHQPYPPVAFPSNAPAGLMVIICSLDHYLLSLIH